MAKAKPTETPKPTPEALSKVRAELSDALYTAGVALTGIRKGLAELDTVTGEDLAAVEQGALSDLHAGLRQADQALSGAIAFVKAKVSH